MNIIIGDRTYELYSKTTIKWAETKMRKGEEVTIPSHIIAHIKKTNDMTEDYFNDVNNVDIKLTEGDGSSIVMTSMTFVGAKEHIKNVITVKFEQISLA